MDIIYKGVERCRDCPFVTNSFREHDDPFTSAPLHTRWWCEAKGGPDYIWDVSRIDPKCPSRQHPDTIRLEKLAGMMELNFTYLKRGFWEFTQDVPLVESEEGSCTPDDLRAWIDAQPDPKEDSHA